MAEYVMPDKSLTTDEAAAQKAWAANVTNTGSVVHISNGAVSSAVTAVVGDVSHVAATLPTEIAAGIVALVETVIPASQPVLNMLKGTIESEVSSLLQPLVDAATAKLEEAIVELGGKVADLAAKFGLNGPQG